METLYGAIAKDKDGKDYLITFGSTIGTSPNKKRIITRFVHSYHKGDAHTKSAIEECDPRIIEFKTHPSDYTSLTDGEEVSQIFGNLTGVPVKEGVDINPEPIMETVKAANIDDYPYDPPKLPPILEALLAMAEEGPGGIKTVSIKLPRNTQDN